MLADIRPAGHLKSLVTIYKDMHSAVASNFTHQKSAHEISGKFI